MLDSTHRLTTEERELADSVCINICTQKTPQLIIDKLYLGPVWASSEVEELKLLGITHILSVGVPPLSRVSEMKYLQIELQDLPDVIANPFPMMFIYPGRYHSAF